MLQAVTEGVMPGRLDVPHEKQWRRQALERKRWAHQPGWKRVASGGFLMPYAVRMLATVCPCASAQYRGPRRSRHLSGGGGHVCPSAHSNMARAMAVRPGVYGTAATIHQGSSRWPLSVCRKAAAGAPSMTRWSKGRLRNIIDR